ncbi:MAG: carboxypeptidase regulatory-like domain-containing protein, partial [Nitrosopumilus sp.]|nr:carboxypeptidase regulatory-like domain-containing protein [Nitrosopumilus sp.]
MKGAVFGLIVIAFVLLIPFSALVDAQSTIGTSITLDSSKSSITTGSTVSFSGKLLNENGIPISGKMVMVSADSDTGRGTGKSAITDSSGRYTVELDNFRENDVGTWTIYAEFEGDSLYKKSSSNSRQLVVSSPGSEPTPTAPTEYYSLNLNVSPSTVLEDETAVISGQLTSSEYISGYEVSVKLTTNTGLTATQWILDGGYYELNVVWPVGV